jgi:hypothetical protein
VLARPRGDRSPAHAREGADLRHGETGECGRPDDCDVGGVRVDQGDEERQGSGACQGLHEDDVALTDPVGQRTGERCADGVGDGERTGREAAEPVAAGGVGDEEQGTQLAHGQGQPGEEGDDDVRRAGELEEPSVGGEG